MSKHGCYGNDNDYRGTGVTSECCRRMNVLQLKVSESSRIPEFKISRYDDI